MPDKQEARQAKFEVYEDSAGEWRWRGIAGNGEIIADSSEGYTRKYDAERARDRAIELARIEVEFTDPLPEGNANDA